MHVSEAAPGRVRWEDAAAAVLAAGLPLAEWEAGRDRAIPAARWVRLLRGAGWPVLTVEVMLPQREHRGGPRHGQRTGHAPQPVVVVPETWLREMARRLGVPWRDACRGTVAG